MHLDNNNKKQVIEDLSLKETREISGGHDGVTYKLGAMWMDSVLATWGLLSSIAVGIEQEIK